MNNPNRVVIVIDDNDDGSVTYSSKYENGTKEETGASEFGQTVDLIVSKLVGELAEERAIFYLNDDGVESQLTEEEARDNIVQTLLLSTANHSGRKFTMSGEVGTDAAKAYLRNGERIGEALAKCE